MRQKAREEKKAVSYDRRWRHASEDEVRAKLNEGAPYVVRFAMPESGRVSFEDKLRGEIEFDMETQEDLVLLKSDGFPTYHLANVVDDHLMGVTHVIRGEEWIPSTIKHTLLYEAFGWDAPEFWHMPLLLNPDRSKLSKRKNPTSILYYRAAGILPEALLNFLALMSYTRPDQEEEKFTLDEFVSDLDLSRISLGGAVFDRKKLNWLNGRYIREDHDAERLLSRMKDWMLSDEKLAKMLPLMQQRMETLGDFMQGADFFFFSDLEYAADELIPKKGDADIALKVLHGLMWEAETIAGWNAESMKALGEKVAAAWELKIRDVTHVMFVSIMGKKVGPPVFDSMAILGPDLCRARLMEAIDRLSAPGNKALKKLRKEWDRRLAQHPTGG
jgi:glutamyl-tRNA synthetase